MGAQPSPRQSRPAHRVRWPRGEDGQEDPQGGDPLAQADHGLVGEAEGEKAAKQAPQRHAQIEEGGPCGGLLGGDPPGHHHEAGGPRGPMVCSSPW